MHTALRFSFRAISPCYWAHPRAANAVANLLWIVLTYAAGVWGEPIHPVRVVSPFLPTRLYIDAIWPVGPWLGFLAEAVAGSVLAIWGYRRDEGQNYR